MTAYEQRLDSLAGLPCVWAVTGVAGFIGSNILQRLLLAGQRVIGLDNFATGHRRNLIEVEQEVGPERWANFRLIQGDVRDRDACHEAFAGVDYVLHQAALGSVPLSLERPDETHAVNVTGFLNALIAARDRKVRRFVYASSCAVYGDDPGSPKVEDRVGNSISPYAASKRMNELYADVFARCYGLASVGLRYFNIYGRRQDPSGAYAAVIPKWMAAVLHGDEVRIHGDGKTGRDFCLVDDVVQANVLAATATGHAGSAAEAGSLVCNVGTGVETTLNDLFAAIRETIQQERSGLDRLEAVHGEFRAGDIRHSRADISRARRLLEFAPAWDLKQGLADAFAWYAGREKPEVART